MPAFLTHSALGFEWPSALASMLVLTLECSSAPALQKIKALLLGPDERVLYAILTAALLAGVGGLILRLRARHRA